MRAQPVIGQVVPLAMRGSPREPPTVYRTHFLKDRLLKLKVDDHPRKAALVEAGEPARKLWLTAGADTLGRREGEGNSLAAPRSPPLQHTACCRRPPGP